MRRRLWGTAIGLLLVAAACTGESSASDLAPTPTSAATVEVVPTSTPVATSTPRPTATPTPTATAIPEPTPTPTGVELYGELLVDGAYTWPVEMPDDLTEDELFAVNIFVSAQNADIAAVAALSDNLSEFEPLSGLVDDALVDLTRKGIAMDRAGDVVRRLAPRHQSQMREIRREETFDDRFTMRVCEHVDLVIVSRDGESTPYAGTSERLIDFELTDEGPILSGWFVSAAEIGKFGECFA